MVLPFLKKKEPAVIPGRGFAPIERVREMASRGFSEPEIIDVLRREGFSPDEIDKALSQALTIGVSQPPPAAPAKPAEAPQPTPTVPRAENIPGLASETVEPAQFPQLPETSLPEEYYSSFSTEEYLDYMVSARLADVNEKIEENNEKIKELENRLNELNKKISELAETKIDQTQTILSKLEEFSESIGEVDTRVGSLEKAFKDTLPSLFSTVKALTEILQKMKKES
jgi:DNA-binding transcriptional MerR regulator